MPDAPPKSPSLATIDWSIPGTRVGIGAPHVGYQCYVIGVFVAILGLSVIVAAARHLISPDWPWALGLGLFGLSFAAIGAMALRVGRRLTTLPALTLDHDAITSNLQLVGQPPRILWSEVASVVLTRIRLKNRRVRAVLLVPSDPAALLRRHHLLKRWALRWTWKVHGRASALTVVEDVIHGDTLDELAQLAADLANAPLDRSDLDNEPG